MGVFEHIMGLIAPHACVGCGTEGAVLCPACAALLPPVRSRCYRCCRPTAAYAVCADCRQHSAVARLFPATLYQDQAKAVLHQLKFARSRAAARDVAHCMRDRLQADNRWLVSFVPTAPPRVRQRGYDQSALIARQLARALGLPYRSLLARSGVERQLGKGRAARQQQMRQAFYVPRPHHTRAVRVLLVDDVVTTGATCEAAAAALVAAGAQQVDVAVFAAA